MIDLVHHHAQELRDKYSECVGLLLIQNHDSTFSRVGFLADLEGWNPDIVLLKRWIEQEVEHLTLVRCLTHVSSSKQHVSEIDGAQIKF